MKVTVTLVVDVDPQDWDADYGTGTSAADVRADVKRHVLNAALQGIEALRDVQLKGGSPA